MTVKTTLENPQKQSPSLSAYQGLESSSYIVLAMKQHIIQLQHNSVWPLVGRGEEVWEELFTGGICKHLNRKQTSYSSGNVIV